MFSKSDQAPLVFLQHLAQLSLKDLQTIRALCEELPVLSRYLRAFSGLSEQFQVFLADIQCGASFAAHSGCGVDTQPRATAEFSRILGVHEELKTRLFDSFPGFRTLLSQKEIEFILVCVTNLEMCSMVTIQKDPCCASPFHNYYLFSYSNFGLFCYLHLNPSQGVQLLLQ